VPEVSLLHERAPLDERARKPGVANAEEAIITVDKSGPRSQVARAIVRRLAADLSARAQGDLLRMGWSGLSTVVVAPASTSALPTVFRPEIVVAGRRTRVLTEQIRALDGSRLGRRVGTLAQTELRAVDDALKVVLGLFLTRHRCPQLLHGMEMRSFEHGKGENDHLDR
jgi:mRNA interferase MazF